MSSSGQTPDELGALGALAEREHRAGRLAEAAAAFRRILAIRPDLAEPHNNLGVIHARQGQFDQAVNCFEQAIRLQPDFFKAYENLGNVLLKQGKLDQAAVRFEQAVTLHPALAEAHYNLGSVLWKLRKPAPAAAEFERAIALKPDYFAALHSLANLLFQSGKLEAAAARFEQMLAMRPNFAEAHNSLGIVLAMTERHDQAMVRFERALALRPDYAEAHANLANELVAVGKFARATAHFRQALALNPNLTMADIGLALCLLIQGDFEHGWPAYEARLRHQRGARWPDLPRWKGEALSGRRLLLVAEEGLGDTLQFIRFARTFKARGARVVLAVQPALGRLLASHPDLDEVVPLDPAAPFPQADFYLPLQSVAGALGINLSNIPTEIPYLSADRTLTASWRDELAKIAGFKIGLTWHAWHDRGLYQKRSIPLAQFAPLSRLPGVQLISLQKGGGSEQIGKVDFSVLDLADRLDEAAGPFMDTAAIIENLDLVITVDTSITHLAGGLGKPVFLALRFSSDWRWLHDRDDSPWYPTVRLFRQRTIGQWQDVFERIAAAIEERLAGKRSVAG